MPRVGAPVGSAASTRRPALGTQSRHVAAFFHSGVVAPAGRAPSDGSARRDPPERAMFDVRLAFIAATIVLTIALAATCTRFW